MHSGGRHHNAVAQQKTPNRPRRNSPTRPTFQQPRARGGLSQRPPSQDRRASGIAESLAANFVGDSHLSSAQARSPTDGVVGDPPRTRGGPRRPSLLLLIGAVIEGIPALLILIPVLLPVAVGLGVDPIQFGVIMNFNLCIGLIYPPMGLALFVVSNISGLSTETLAWAVLPFLVPLLIALLLFTYIPRILAVVAQLAFR